MVVRARAPGDFDIVPTLVSTISSRPGHPRVFSAPRRFVRRPTLSGGTWFGFLLASVCLEGLGRRFVPGVPGSVWYFLKDAILITGLVSFGIGRAEWRVASALYRPFALALLASLAWVLLAVFNPAQQSLALGLVGLRAYSLWWIAPVVVANALKAERDYRRAVAALAVLAIAITGLAALQFQLPGDAPINRYAWGEANSVAGIVDTGRVRVISTFAYLSGFTDFVILATPLLLAMGLAEGKGRLRLLSLSAAGAIAITAPMSGSRGAVMMVAVAALAIFWSLGAFATKRGLALAAALAIFTALPYLLVPEAVAGVESRFEGPDTRSRFEEVRMIIPVFAIAELDYPLFGIGTGMLQNAREAFGVGTQWLAEGEPGRYLVELGIVGYMLVWTARLGLLIALARASRLLRRCGRRAAAGLALALAGLTFLGNLTFDHVWQALFFVASGLVLREAVSVVAVSGSTTSSNPARAGTRTLAGT